eukprot:699505_1
MESTKPVHKHGVLATKLNNELEYLVMGYIRCNIEGNKRIKLGKIIPYGVKLVLAKFYGLGWIYSSILNFDEMNMLSSLLSTRLNINNTFSLKLLYRSSRDGGKAFVFHEKCDNIPNTVTLIQSQFKHVFGGFTNLKWIKQNKLIRRDDVEDHKHDTFLFLLRSQCAKNKTLPQVFDVKRSIANPILVQHGSSLGPCFGFEDVHVLSNMSDAHTYYNGSFHLLKGTTNTATTHPLSGRNDSKQIGVGSGRSDIDRFQAYKIEVFQLVIGDT